MFNLSNELIRLTDDHSVVQKLINNKEITEEQAFTHPKRNVITSAIGQNLDHIKIDISEEQKIQKDEILLVCSDGLHDALKDNEIRKILFENSNKSNLAKILVEKAYKSGAKDNITICIYKH